MKVARLVVTNLFSIEMTYRVKASPLHCEKLQNCPATSAKLLLIAKVAGQFNKA